MQMGYFIVKCVGCSFYNASKLAQRIDQLLLVERDLTNQHDEWAMKLRLMNNDSGMYNDSIYMYVYIYIYIYIYICKKLYIASMLSVL